MEMCYDGTLVMPSNYAVMSEDEMVYVDGGASYEIDPKNPGRSIILLSNKEAKKVADAGTPATCLAGLIPKAGPVVAAAVGICAWTIGKKNKGKGVKIIVDVSCPVVPYVLIKSR